MEKIASFQIDHTRLQPGLYISRTDGDVVTYDLRFVKPNTPPYLETNAMHTIEHLFATYVRSSRFGRGILYFGPMGCRTGFYLLTRTGDHPDAVLPADLIALVLDTLCFIAAFEGEIPGASAAECGNWREHNLPLAREYARCYAQVLQGYTPEQMQYPV